MANSGNMIVALTFTTHAPRCPCGDAATGVAAALLDSGDLVTWSTCDACAHCEIRKAALTMVRFGEGTFVETVTAKHWQLAKGPPLRA